MNTYTRSLSSNVVLKYSSKLTAIFDPFYFFFKDSNKTVYLKSQDGAVTIEIQGSMGKCPRNNPRIPLLSKAVRCYVTLYDIVLQSGRGRIFILNWLYSMSSICLWVKPDPFEFGAIHAPLPPKLTLHVSFFTSHKLITNKA